MSTFEEVLEKKIAETPEKQARIDLKDLPQEIMCKIIKYELKEDTTHKECMYLTMITEDGKFFTQKYTPTCWTELNTRIKNARGYEYLSNNFTMWKQDFVGRATKPRMYPATDATTKPKEKPKK
jgi:hypothetical protein